MPEPKKAPEQILHEVLGLDVEAVAQLARNQGDRITRFPDIDARPRIGFITTAVVK